MRKLNLWVLGVVAAMGLSTWAGAAGTATGQFIVNGKRVTFTSAVARVTADFFDPSKKGYSLVLSDVKGLPDKYGSLEKVTAGTLHYIELSLGHDKSVYGAMLHHSAFKNQTVSSAGSIELEVEKFGPDILAGKVSMAPKTFDGATFQFTATFSAPIDKER